MVGMVRMQKMMGKPRKETKICSSALQIKNTYTHERSKQSSQLNYYMSVRFKGWTDYDR